MQSPLIIAALVDAGFNANAVLIATTDGPSLIFFIEISGAIGTAAVSGMPSNLIIGNMLEAVFIINRIMPRTSVRLDIRKTNQIKEGEEIVGNRTRVKIVKNKLAPPFKKADFDILYGEGISQLGEIVDLGTDFNIIKKSGSWFSYGDTKIGQGRDAVKQILKDNPELLEELKAKVQEALKKQ